MVSKIYNLVEEEKIPTVELGDFCIKTAVVSYDYARCFIAENNNAFYAFLEIENSNELFGWNVTRVNLDDVNDVNSGDKPVQSLFLNKNEMYQLFFKNGSESGILEKVFEFVGRYAIKGEMFVKNFCDMDVTFDYHGFAANAIEQNSNKVSVVLQNKNGCNTNSFFKIVKYFNSICKKLAHPLDIMKSTMTVVHASTVVTFTFDDGEKGLFEDKENRIAPSTSESIAELGNMLSTSDPSLLLSNQSKNTLNVLKKYNRLIDEFNKTNDPQPKIVIATPNADKPISYQMKKTLTRQKKKAIEEAISYLKESSKTDENKVEYEGILTGIITSGGNYFGFKTKNGTIMGDVDFKLVGSNQFDVGGTIYRATVNVIKVISKNGEVLKESNRLIGLEPIGKVVKYSQTNLFE